MRKMLRVFVTALVLVGGLGSPVLGQSQSTDDTWKSFREAYPYHIQCVALTEPNADGLRVLIVAEPPPHVTLESLKAIDPLILQNPKVRRHEIGYDGWAADVIFVLPAMSRENLKTMLDRLNHQLYGTTYKATVVALPTRVNLVQKRNLDLRVPAGELGEWVLGDLAHPKTSRGWMNLIGLIAFGLLSAWNLRKIAKSGKNAKNLIMLAISCSALLLVWFGGSVSHDKKMLGFSSVLGGDKHTGREILESKISGVFLSDTPGVVLWSFSRKLPIDTNRIHAREFALDSDVLIGAVATQDQVVILGRERSLPVDVLPPLRTETIVQLASANTDELAQSYERTNLLAGKFDGQNDWAPIYLSRNLIDTEYGSLLNITDQILKSWSMHGFVRYINFKYPDPERYPFPTDLMRYAKTNRVTFNWNTKGVGYTTKNNAYEVFALHRTGALPVDYLSADNSELQKDEEDGYTYFATLNDPNLVRVVQYAALYQIFRRFSVTTTQSAATESSGDSTESPDALRLPIAQIVATVGSMTDEQFEEMRNAASNAKEDSAELLKTVEALKDFRDGIQDLDENGGPGALAKLVNAMADPREAMQRFRNLSKAEQTDTETTIAALVQLSQESKRTLRYLSRANLAAVKDAYVSELSRTNWTWIRTPTIVISWLEKGVFEGSVEGGHNLDAQITQFRFDPSLNPGEIHVIEENGQKVILHSAEDADKAPELVRFAARNEEKSSSDLETILKSKLPEVEVRERTLDEALAFTTDARPAAARGYQPTGSDPSLGSMGWKPTQDVIPQRQSELLNTLKSPTSHSVIVSRQESGSYLVAHGSSTVVVESEDMPSAVDAAISCIKDESQGASDVKLYLAGFEPRQGKGFAKSVEMNLTEGEFPKLTATIEGEPIEPEELSRLLRKEYRLEEAKVTKLAVADDKSVDVELTVPSKEVARPSLIVRLKLWFEEGFEASAQVLDSIQTIVESWKSSLSTATEKLDIFLARKKLIQDLKSVHPEITDVDVIYSRERKDLFYGAKNRDSERDDRGSRQAV
jgi:hypothetical protein